MKDDKKKKKKSEIEKLIQLLIAQSIEKTTKEVVKELSDMLK